MTMTDGIRGMIDKRRLMTLLCLLAGHFVGGAMAVAQPVVIDHEYEYKAAYLYHFAGLCEWPDGETGPIVVGVLGPNRFGRQLQRIEKQSENLPRPIDTQVFGDIGQYKSCQILFIAGSKWDAQAEQRMQQILKKTKDQATLIFTEVDDPEFIRAGVSVNFYIDDNRLRLLINRKAAKEAGVVIPDRLLKLKSASTVPPLEADD
jgi:hypothetical protein